MKQILLLFLLPTMLLFSCTTDECESVICNNGGTCDTGTCVCPAGYDGEFCDNQKMPTAVILTKVEVTRYPEFDWGGAAWDEDSAPDLFIYSRDLDETHADTSNVLMDYEGGVPVSFDLNFSMTELDEEHYIILGDLDENGDWEGLGSYWFEPFVEGDGFPETQEFLQPGLEVDFKIYLEYIF